MNARQRRIQIRQQQNRKEKRRKLRTLTVEERERLGWFKKSILIIDVPWGSDRRRTLSQVNAEHGKNFLDVARKLSGAFPHEEIQVLDEGSGESTLYNELPGKLKGITKVKVTRTDIDPRIESTSESPFVNCTVEDLVKKFGHDRFHLVISTHGGVAQTPGSQLKALTNLFSILKPGGEAHIVAGSKSNLAKTTNFIQTVLKRSGSASDKTLSETLLKLNKLFKNIEIYQTIGYSQNGNPVSLLTIKKLKNSRRKQ